MPGMDGLELQDEMTASGYQLSVVFITAHPKDEDRRRALRGGAAQYLEKPVSADVLLPSVRTCRSDTNRSGRSGPPVSGRVRE